MTTRVRRATAAFTLVEVALALGIASFCLLAVFGLLPVALQSNQAAIQQTAAAGILTDVLADLRATPPTIPTGAAAVSNQYSISIPASGQPASGSRSQTLYFDGDQHKTSATLATCRVTLTFLPPPSGAVASAVVRSSTIVCLNVSWPATVDPANGAPAGSVQTFAALDRN